MTTFLTIITPDKQAIETSPSLSQLLLPRQTISSDAQTQSDSSSSSSSGTATATTTTAPILRTIDGVVYFRTSMPALDVVGVPVTTVTMGDPSRPIAIWNSTQAHGYAVSNTVGQWAALGVLAAFGLVFLVLFSSESIGFLRRRINGNASKDEDEEFIDRKKKKFTDIPLSEVDIPLTTRQP